VYKYENIDHKERQSSQPNVDDEVCKYAKTILETRKLLLHDNDVTVCSILKLMSVKKTVIAS